MVNCCPSFKEIMSISLPKDATNIIAILAFNKLERLIKVKEDPALKNTLFEKNFLDENFDFKLLLKYMEESIIRKIFDKPHAT